MELNVGKLAQSLMYDYVGLLNIQLCMSDLLDPAEQSA